MMLSRWRFAQLSRYFTVLQTGYSIFQDEFWKVMCAVLLYICRRLVGENTSQAAIVLPAFVRFDRGGIFSRHGSEKALYSRRIDMLENCISFIVICSSFCKQNQTFVQERINSTKNCCDFHSFEASSLKHYWLIRLRQKHAPFHTSRRNRHN